MGQLVFALSYVFAELKTLTASRTYNQPDTEGKYILAVDPEKFAILSHFLTIASSVHEGDLTCKLF